MNTKAEPVLSQEQLNPAQRAARRDAQMQLAVWWLAGEYEYRPDRGYIYASLDDNWNDGRTEQHLSDGDLLYHLLVRLWTIGRDVRIATRCGGTWIALVEASRFESTEGPLEALLGALALEREQE